jgi:Na+/H+ antiporter NhaD/arsenite permease-like protein
LRGRYGRGGLATGSGAGGVGASGRSRARLRLAQPRQPARGDAGEQVFETVAGAADAGPRQHRERLEPGYRAEALPDRGAQPAQRQPHPTGEVGGGGMQRDEVIREVMPDRQTTPTTARRGKRQARATAPAQRRNWPGVVGIALVVLVIVVALISAAAPGLLPASPGLDEGTRKVAAAVIFAASYLALAIGKVPGLNIDRAGVALVGASLMVASGALSLEDAYRAIDLDTITLLLGMMIVVASLRLSGFFAIATTWIAGHAKRPMILLCAVTATSGIFSAFLVNDAICLVLAPLVLELTLRMGRKPVPYLLAVAMASNVGSTATITGNPQNIMIGSFSHIPYTTFALALAPVALIGLVVTVGLIALTHREEFAGSGRMTAVNVTIRVNRVLVGRALMATALMVALFFAGQPPAKAAIIIGGLLLLTRRVRSERVYAEIDWSLLLMFAGLFIIVAGAQRALLTPDMVARVGRLHLDQVPILSAVTAVLSNLVSNVPAVLMMKPFVESLPDHATAWLTIAMASTLAGNFTILGSIANLIVVQKGAARGVVIGFWDYFRVGAPLTVITLAIGTLWMWL